MTEQEPRKPNLMIEITKDQAAEAVTAAASKVDDPEPADQGRQILHCLLGGGFGADWDLEEVLRAIEAAARVGWHTGPLSMGHDLVVLAEDGKAYRFLVERPKETSEPYDRECARKVIASAVADIDYGGVGELFEDDWDHLPPEEFEDRQRRVHDLATSAAVTVTWPEETADARTD